MLHRHLDRRAPEGSLATEPLVDDHAQRVLVTGWPRLALHLFGGQIRSCPRQRRVQHLCAGRVCWQEQCQPKVCQQQLLASIQQHILRLDVAVDEALVMGVLQGRGHLDHIDEGVLEGEACACRVPGVTS